MSEGFFLIEDAPEGGFSTRALGYSIYTQADTWDELKQAIQDAITCHFDEQQRPALEGGS
jgi:hypothetical protein